MSDIEKLVEASNLHTAALETPSFTDPKFRGSWKAAIKAAHQANPNVRAELLFHDSRRSAVRVMVQEAGLPESQAMLISGHQTREMLERYNIVSLRNVQDAGKKLDAWHAAKNRSVRPREGVA